MRNSLSIIALALGYWVILVGPAQAYSINTVSAFERSRPDENNCNLPAPETVSTVSCGPDWIKLKWTTVSGAAGYVVKAYRLPALVLDANFQVPGNNTTINGLYPGGNYLFTITAKCANGGISNQSGTEYKNLIVLDIVINSSGHPPICPLVKIGEECVTVPWDLDGEGASYWAKVSNGAVCKMFEIQTAGQMGSYLSFTMANGGNCNSAGFGMTDSEVSAIVNFMGSPVCTLGFTQIGEEIPELEICDLFSPVFSVEFFKEKCPEGNITPPDLVLREANEFITMLLGNLITNFVRCKVFSPNGAPFSLRLVSLDGQKCYEQAFNGMRGEQEIEINTTELPLGLYFLQVATTRETQIFKVVKGQ